MSLSVKDELFMSISALKSGNPNKSPLNIVLAKSTGFDSRKLKSEVSGLLTGVSGLTSTCSSPVIKLRVLLVVLQRSECGREGSVRHSTKVEVDEAVEGLSFFQNTIYQHCQ